MANGLSESVVKARYLYPCCPLCDSDRLVDFKTGDCSRHALYNPVIPALMQWRKCLACEHVFTDGYFTPEAQRIVFAKVHNFQKPGHDAERERFLSARVVDRVAAVQGLAGGCWLDVGLGNGSLLHTAQEWGYEPVGIDLRRDSVSAMQVLGFEAHHVDLLEFNQFQRFNVVSMADVLEHMPFPRPVLRHVVKLLRPDGILFLSMPNSDSFVWRALDRAGQNPYWGELEHYHNFGRARLYALLRECGFAPVRYGVSERYRACMEVIATIGDQGANRGA